MKRPLLLNGFAGVGKSTVGRLIAQRSGRPFTDLTNRSANNGSLPPPSAAPSRGAERKTLRSALTAWRQDSSQLPVVALGADTLLSRDDRLVALDECVVALLEASPEKVLERDSLQARAAPPNAHACAEIAEQMSLREGAYAECHGKVTDTGLMPDAMASMVERLWERDPLAVAAKERSYAVDVGNGICASELGGAVGSASLVMLITDENVAPLHAEGVRQILLAAGLQCATIVFHAGEQHKNLETMNEIWKQALASGADRSSVFVALGGGVVTDIGGFAASAWMRGVRWVSIPTTLLGMVDASVGGKTGVDLLNAKNAVGAFWQPSAVLCDISHLRTEPQRGFVSALAEVVKTALIGDPGLLDILEQRSADVRRRDLDAISEVVRRCVRVKARVVSRDEREGGLRATLNLGHTIGHALEAGAGYTGLTHGEAISLGLVAAVRIGQKQGWTPPAVAERTVTLLRDLGLPVSLDRDALTRAASLIFHDKKRQGTMLRFVVVHDVGHVEPTPVPVDDLTRWAADLEP